MLESILDSNQRPRHVVQSDLDSGFIKVEVMNIFEGSLVLLQHPTKLNQLLPPVCKRTGHARLEGRCESFIDLHGSNINILNRGGYRSLHLLDLRNWGG